MGVKNVILLIRKLHPQSILIVDDYDQYFVFDRDCYVVYYLANLSMTGKKNKVLSNSIKYLEYLLKVLEENHVNYMVLEKRHGYNVSQYKFFQDNCYQKYWKIGKLVYKREKEILDIVQKLKVGGLEYSHLVKRVQEVICNCDI